MQYIYIFIEEQEPHGDSEQRSSCLIQYSASLTGQTALSGGRNVRDAGQLPATLGETRFLRWSGSVMGVRLTVSQAGQYKELQSLGPVSGSLDI